MKHVKVVRSLAAGVAVLALTVAVPARAIEKCKVKVGKTGVIEVGASGVSGTLQWGAESGAEDTAFFNAGTCVADGKAKGCQLADPGSLEARTPPAGCTIYLDDGVAPCSAWIRGCTPGARAEAEAASFADFFALMPPDNAVPVFPGAAVAFPSDGPTTASIYRVGASTFVLGEIGTYEVQFAVSVTEAGQLVLVLNGVESPTTTVGRATGTSQIVGVSLVTTTTAGTLLEVRNPVSASSPVTITPLAGGANPSSAHLVIKKL
jgi:hypothetical protein